MTNKEIIQVFEDIFFEDDYVETSRLHDPEFGTTEDGTIKVKLFGGLNGGGEGKDYLYDLFELLESLESNNIAGFVRRFEVDPLDDVFYVELELRDFKEYYNGKPE